jgi:hypothetical protein
MARARITSPPTISGAGPVPGPTEAPRVVARSAGRPVGAVKLREVVDVTVEPVDTVVVVVEVARYRGVGAAGARPATAAGVWATLAAGVWTSAAD